MQFLLESNQQSWDSLSLSLSILSFFTLSRHSAMAKSDFSCVEARFPPGILPLRCGSPNASPEVVHRPRSEFPLHFNMWTYSKFARENNFPALSVCFLQSCSSAGHKFAASRLRVQNLPRIVSCPQQKFQWNALSTGFHWESAFVREIPNPTLKPENHSVLTSPFF